MAPRQQSGTVVATGESMAIRIGPKPVLFPVRTIQEALDVLEGLYPFGDSARLSQPGAGAVGSFLFEYNGIIGDQAFSGADLEPLLAELFLPFAIPQSFDHAYGGSYVHVRRVDSGGGATDHRFFFCIELRAEYRDVVLDWLRRRKESEDKEEWLFFTLD
ncbi:MAG: hypothetical protein Q7S16_03905 [bacterium]|nr:hypothetical protein [bacterium]